MPRVKFRHSVGSENKRIVSKSFFCLLAKVDEFSDESRDVVGEEGLRQPIIWRLGSANEYEHDCGDDGVLLCFSIRLNANNLNFELQ